MPENQSTEEDELFEEYKPDFQFIPSGRHVYRQNGPYLVCRECALHHAVFIGMEKMMVGEDDEGTPILRQRSELK